MLVDSNVILRTLQPRSPDHETAQQAIRILKKQGWKVSLTPQNLVEVWAVATRPERDNGLGFSIERAAAELKRLKTIFTILAEAPDLYPAWEALVIKHRVSGKPTHDARLVAAMQVHGETSILTFNKGDFARYAGIGIVDPADVVVNA